MEIKYIKIKEIEQNELLVKFEEYFLYKIHVNFERQTFLKVNSHIVGCAVAML